MKQNLKQNARNRAAKSRTNTLHKKVETAIKEQKPKNEVLDTFKDFASFLDNVTRKGIYHPNTSARKKSRLMKRINAL